MIIQNLETKHFRIPLLTTMTDSTHGDMTHFEVIMVKIGADDGTQGIGYTYTIGQGGAAIKSLIDEACVWHYQGGIAALLSTDGPEKNTIQYAPDGINFEIMSVLKGTPEAIGLVRSNDSNKGPLDDLNWGLCHRYDESWQWQYIRRFETYFPRIV